MTVEEKIKLVEEFLGDKKGENEEALIIENNNTEVIKLLNRIVENQDIDRRDFERNHPLISDSLLYDWAELVTPPGYLATFTLTINEGVALFLNYFNITYNEDTVYNITIDGVIEPTVTDPVQDWADHAPFFFPPRICQSHVIITALNGSAITQTYGCFMNGFFRSNTKIDREYLGAR